MPACRQEFDILEHLKHFTRAFIRCYPEFPIGSGIQEKDRIEKAVVNTGKVHKSSDSENFTPSRRPVPPRFDKPEAGEKRKKIKRAAIREINPASINLEG